MHPTGEVDSDSASAYDSLARLIDGLTVASCTVDYELRLVSWDGPVDCLLECDPAALSKGESVIDLAPNAERADWLTAAHEVLTGKAPERSLVYTTEPSAGTAQPIRRILFRPIRAGREITGLSVIGLCADEESLRGTYPPIDRERLDLARQLAVTLNHEINNPLFVVSASLEDVLAEPLEPQVEKRLEMALEKVWKVAEAVKQLQEMRQIVSTTYISGYTMIDLEASSHNPPSGT